MYTVLYRQVSTFTDFNDFSHIQFLYYNGHMGSCYAVILHLTSTCPLKLRHLLYDCIASEGGGVQEGTFVHN